MRVDEKWWESIAYRMRLNAYECTKIPSEVSSILVNSFPSLSVLFAFICITRCNQLSERSWAVQTGSHHFSVPESVIWRVNAFHACLELLLSCFPPIVWTRRSLLEVEQKAGLAVALPAVCPVRCGMQRIKSLRLWCRPLPRRALRLGGSFTARAACPQFLCLGTLGNA